MIDRQTRLCALLERISHRSTSNANDLLRAHMCLDFVGGIYSSLSGSGSAGRPKEVEEDALLLCRDLDKLSAGLSSLASLSEARSSAFEDSTLERLKMQRETWRALDSLLERYKAKLQVDNVEMLKKRIEGSKSRYASLQATTKPEWQEEGKKVLDGIEKDQEAMAGALSRRAVLKWIMAQEVRWVWRCSARLRVDVADWSADESAHAARIARIWTGLEDALALSG